MRYSKTNTTWFISRSSENSWSLGVGFVRLLPSRFASGSSPRIQHRGTSNFHYFPQCHVVFVYYYIATSTKFLHTTGCLNPLGMKDDTIPDSNIKASSALLDPNDGVFVYNGYEGRLDAGAFWLPSDSSSSWVQVDFGYPNFKVINGIITQGSNYWNRWVKTLQVQYRNDVDGALLTILEGDSPKVKVVQRVLFVLIQVFVFR